VSYGTIDRCYGACNACQYCPDYETAENPTSVVLDQPRLRSFSSAMLSRNGRDFTRRFQPLARAQSASPTKL
jgi:hypothetical protein